MSVSEHTFGGRLRRERERRHIPLSSISANTKISVSYFEALERDDISRWPSGIFRRAFIRAYAAGIGLDPDAIAKEFAERFPDPAELALVAPAEAPTTATAARSGSTSSSDAVLRLTLADTGTRFVPGALLAGMRSRCAAVGFDAAATLIVAISMYGVSGLFWLPLGTFTFLYYLGGILVLGNTPGVCLCAQTPKRPPDADPTHNVGTAPRNLLENLRGLRDRAARAARVERREDLRV